MCKFFSIRGGMIVEDEEDKKRLWKIFDVMLKSFVIVINDNF